MNVRNIEFTIDFTALQAVRLILLLHQRLFYVEFHR